MVPLIASCLMMVSGFESLMVEKVPNVEAFAFENCWYRDVDSLRLFTAKGTVLTSSSSTVVLRMEVNSKCRITSQKIWTVPANKEFDSFIPFMNFELKKNWKHMIAEHPEVCP